MSAVVGEAMLSMFFVLRLVCLCTRLFVCLFVSRITQTSTTVNKLEMISDLLFPGTLRHAYLQLSVYCCRKFPQSISIYFSSTFFLRFQVYAATVFANFSSFHFILWRGTIFFFYFHSRDLVFIHLFHLFSVRFAFVIHPYSTNVSKKKRL